MSPLHFEFVISVMLQLIAQLYSCEYVALQEFLHPFPSVIVHVTVTDVGLASAGVPIIGITGAVPVVGLAPIGS